MKTFIINLKTHENRRNHMKTLCDKIHLDYEFVDAVYGQEIYNIESYTMNKHETIKSLHREMSKGEIGCILSHQLIYNRIIQDNIPYAMILEDDIDLDLNIINILNKIYFDNFEFDTILLGYHSTNSREVLDLNKSFLKSLNYGVSLYELNEIAYGAYGYIISLKGALKIYEQSSNFILPIDHYTGNYRLNKILCLYPQCININRSLSDNSILTQERTIMHLNEKFKNEFLFLSNKISNTNKNIIIYGFNDLGFLVYKKFQNRVSAIIDKNKFGYKIDNIQIKSIENITNCNNVVFVITAINENYINEIQDIINKKFEKNEIINIKRENF